MGNPQLQSPWPCRHDLETVPLTSVNLIFGTGLHPHVHGLWGEFGEKMDLEDPAQCLAQRKRSSMVAFIRALAGWDPEGSRAPGTEEAIVWR